MIRIKITKTNPNFIAAVKKAEEESKKKFERYFAIIKEKQKQNNGA